MKRHVNGVFSRGLQWVRSPLKLQARARRMLDEAFEELERGEAVRGAEQLQRAHELSLVAVAAMRRETERYAANSRKVARNSLKTPWRSKLSY